MATCWPSGNTFQSGHIAMTVVHQWYTCCVYPGEGEPRRRRIGTSPSCPSGRRQVTSKLHADTIGIMDSTEHPDEAFEALTYLAASPSLIQTWGAMPGRREPAGRVLRRSRRAFAPVDIDWNVSSKMLGYPDNPEPRGSCRTSQESDAANKAFGSKLWTTEGLDIDAELDAHVQTLQGIFDAEAN